MSVTSLSEVQEYLHEHNHPGLTPKKVRERATTVESSTDPDQVVFDIERHRSALGSRYIEGTGMAAFETYWERYVFDRDQGSLEKQGENMSETQNPRIDVKSYRRLAERRLEHTINFSLENRNQGGYVAKNTVGSSSRVVRSKEEFLEFARDEQEDMWLAVPRSADVVLEDRYGVSEECIQEMLCRLNSAEVDYVERKASREWERAIE